MQLLKHCGVSVTVVTGMVMVYCIATALGGDGWLFPVWMVISNSAGGYIVTGVAQINNNLPLAIIHSYVR